MSLLSINKCPYCGNTSKKTDYRGNCISCGGSLNNSAHGESLNVSTNNKFQEITMNGFASNDALALAEKVSAWNGGREVFFIMKKEYLSVLWDSRFFTKNQEEEPAYFMNKYKVFSFPENSELDRNYIYIIPVGNKNVIGKILL
ncbi:MAG: hypothetical protein WA061_02820 [Microgenomates group bacterium]